MEGSNGGIPPEAYTQISFCPGCGQRKTRDNFYFNSHGDYWAKGHTCTKCKKTKHTKAHRRTCRNCNMPFESTSWARNYCSDECKNATHDRTRFEILERDDFTCIYCGKSSFDDGVKLHVDHIYPKTKGGRDTADNLATACQDCNTSKNSRILSKDVQRKIIDVVKARNKKNSIPDRTVYNLR